MDLFFDIRTSRRSSFPGLASALLLIAFAFLFLAPGILQGQSVGTVQGTVADPTGAVIPSARVTLTSAISGYNQTATTDNNGQYRFVNVPFAAFTVHAEAKGFSHGDQKGELRTNVPIIVNITLPLQTTTEEVVVTEDAPLLETSSAATHRDLDYQQLGKLPVTQANRGMEAVVQSVPGMVQDDNGRLHARGSESQVQYVIDGVPVTDQASAVFSTSLDSSNLRSAEIITGNVPAEYGGKLGAVVNVNTKSGLEMPWNGSVSLGAGSFLNREIGVELGGHTKKFGVFLSADGSQTHRYLDPPEVDNFHNHGGNTRLFTKLDFNASSHDTFRLVLSVNGSDLQVPNRLEQQLLGQHQRQELRDDSQSLGWNHLFGDNASVLDFVAYRRSSSGRLLDPGITGFPFWAQQVRRQRTEGFRGSYSKEWKWNSFKTGLQFQNEPLREDFVVAATDPAILSDPTNPASTFTVANPFRFSDRATGKEFAYYLQDRIKLFDRFTVDLGLRYDHYHIVLQEDYLSPRIGLAYYLKPSGTVLRASYNRLFQTPPNENLLLSSSPEGAVFSQIGASSPQRAVPPEKQNFYEFGVQQQIGKYMRLDVARYVKNARNFSDKDQFLDTGVIFPIAIARGDIRGTEVRLDLAQVRGVTAFLSYANSKAVGTTPLVGGLFLGESTSELLEPGVQFMADHDTRNAGQFGVTYTHRRSGAWVTFTGRHDSGVPSDFDPAELASLDPRVRNELDPVRFRVKPRTTFDFATGIELLRETRYPVTLQLAVANLADEFFLYNFESVFSGTHVGRPREITGRVVFHWQSEAKQNHATPD
ncbi:MAG: TonB-dependent receptor [Acidobacteriales bacterium]|nr:TonB-dependent receptor [Terriglobales bacterium]